MTETLQSTQTLRDHHAYVTTDNPWQQRARLMQSLWRERQGLLPGPRSPGQDELLGSRLTTADGVPVIDGRNGPMRNYLSPAARDQALLAVDDAPRTGALLSRPRLWVDLLSSQPLCFNLFGPLAADLSMATTVLAALWPGRIDTVTHVWFEYSPGRGDPRYTGNRSAFDVFVDYEGPAGRGFLGIEVKYHESLAGAPAADPDGRYPDLARGTGAFHSDALDRLTRAPLQQLWLDHLLALRLLQNGPPPCDHGGPFAEGLFVLLYPAANTACANAAAAYTACLANTSTFQAVTLDHFLETARQLTPGSWADQIFDRYLDTTHLGEPAGEDIDMPPSDVR